MSKLPPLLRIATSPAVSVASGATVEDAVRAMVRERVGAVAVMDGDRLAGIFTERDLMRKVVHEARDPASTPVADVMVRDPVSVTPESRRRVALELMLERHFRHLPVVDESGAIQGMLSIRDLLREQVTRLTDDVSSLEQYLSADGPGG